MLKSKKKPILSVDDFKMLISRMESMEQHAYLHDASLELENASCSHQDNAQTSLEDDLYIVIHLR